MTAAALAALLFAALPGDPLAQQPGSQQLARAWEVAGTSRGGHLGQQLAFLGDIDFDGVSDLLAAAPGARRDGGQRGEGLVHLLSGADGRILWTIHGAEADEGLGRGLAVLDDVNVDGRPDFAVLSARAQRPEGDGWQLAAAVRSGRDGALLWPLVIDKLDERLGAGLVATGDADDDGHVDLLVGSVADQPGLRDAPTAKGVAVLCSGATGRELLRFTGETPDFGRVVLGRSQLGEEAGVAFGIADTRRLFLWSGDDEDPACEAALPEGFGAGDGAVSPGDVDQDGQADLLVQIAAVACGPAPGTVAVRFSIHARRDGRRLGEFAWRALEGPCAVASFPDLDGDGLRELVLGDPGDFAGRGRVELVHPVSGGVLSTLRGGQVKRAFGAALATRDVLGEGLGPGLAVAAVDDDRGALDGGSVALFTLKPLPRPRR